MKQHGLEVAKLGPRCQELLQSVVALLLPDGMVVGELLQRRGHLLLGGVDAGGEQGDQFGNLLVLADALEVVLDGCGRGDSLDRSILFAFGFLGEKRKTWFMSVIIGLKPLHTIGKVSVNASIQESRDM